MCLQRHPHKIFFFPHFIVSKDISHKYISTIFEAMYDASNQIVSVKMSPQGYPRFRIESSTAADETSMDNYKCNCLSPNLPPVVALYFFI